MRKQTAETFWEKVDKSGECWVWTRNSDKNGYGLVRWHGKYVKAHRLAYRLATGVDPAGMYVCHKCDNPPCVRPDHLFLGDNQINQKDSVEKGRNRHANTTHCPAGHAYDEPNTYVDPRGHRQCRECRRIQKITAAGGTLEVTLVEYFQPLITTPMTVGQSAEVQREEGALNDCEFGWMGYHYWQAMRYGGDGERKCLMCGRVKP
jgi:HNH endonuclease